MFVLVPRPSCSRRHELLFAWRWLARIEQLGARLWRRLAPLTRNLSAERLRGSFSLWMLWGWLPCGMVYSMLLVAALWQRGGGGGAMLCFGLGTVPAILAAGLASGRLLRLRPGRRLNWTLGVLVLTFGILTVVAPWILPAHAAVG